MARFLTPLDICCHPTSDKYFRLATPLVYQSDILKDWSINPERSDVKPGTVIVPAGFWCDLASVPRIPLAYWWYGHRAHHEGVVHDYLYRIGARCGFMDANRVFLEAMEVRGKPFYVRYPMFAAVCAGGWWSYNTKPIDWVPKGE